ncbi:MAG: metal ABC transporter permease [bacterium]|jgi:zinc/manganese transport system permease protein
MEILVNSVLISIILVFMHSYFGIEIIKRGIIFTDIAIGQFIGLGIAFSLFLFNENVALSFIFSLIFGLIGSLLIYIVDKNRVYSEALIGILYAFSFSLTILVLSKSVQGAEKFLNIITTSDILFVSKNTIIFTFFYYSLLFILIYYVLKNKNKYYNVLFFIIFCLVLINSVKIAGVFVVFSILLAPALVSHILNINDERKLLFSTIYGSLVNIIAIIVSYYLDFPTSATIVFFQTFLSIIIYFYFILKKNKSLVVH